jgi:hypothetical protein
LNPFQNIYDAQKAYFGTGVTGYEWRVEQLDRMAMMRQLELDLTYQRASLWVWVCDPSLRQLLEAAMAGPTRRGYCRHRVPVGSLLKGRRGRTQARVERSLYERANGYNYDAVKIFMPAGSKQPVVVHYTEHCPPDVGAAFIWLKNRDPDRWRDVQNVEQSRGQDRSKLFEPAISLP